jgi:hypothetical protein
VLRAIDPRHRHHVAGGEAVEHPQEFAPVGPSAGHLLPIDVPAAASGGAKLLKLAVVGLPVSADASIVETAILRMSSGHILREA